MHMTRAAGAILSLCLLAAACQTDSTTAPVTAVSDRPVLDGIGVVGGGGRSDSTTTTDSALPPGDSTVSGDADLLP